MVNKKPQKAVKVVEAAPAASTTQDRLNRLVGDLLTMLEKAVDAGDPDGLKSLNIVPALNSVTRLAKLLGEEEETFSPEMSDPMEMLAADCDLMVSYCIRRMCFLAEGVEDLNKVEAVNNLWMEATEQWRK